MTNHSTHSTPSTAPRSPVRQLWLAAAVIAAFAALGLMLAAAGEWNAWGDSAEWRTWDTAAQRLEAARAWLESKGHVGILAYALVFAIFGLLALPVSPWTIVGALVYGPVLGFFVIHVSATLAAACAFLLARRWLRPALHGRFLAWQQRLTASHRSEAVRLVFLLRMSPVVPFAVLNYAAGVSRMRSVDFLLATAIGKVPNAALYTYSVAAARRLWESPPEEGISGIIFWVGLAATALGAWQLSRVAARNLKGLDLSARASSARSRD